MNYQQTIDFLYRQLPCYQRIGQAAYKEDLHNTIALLDAIGNPHKSLRCIHIAGTNGKGSVSHMCASILQEAGYKTGLYTSPHLIDFRERIKINGECISKRYITQFVNKYGDAITQIQPSFFEITVAMSFAYFKDKNIDIAVIETGLGGRLDSTNVIKPLLSIITNIGLDHTQLLGNTIEKIALEKAGIIKEFTPVIIGETNLQTKKIFEKKSQELNSPISFADSIYSIQTNTEKNWNEDFSIHTNDTKYFSHLQSDLPGIYQKKNVLSVITAMVELQTQKFCISNKAIKKGLASVIPNTGLLGRWQIIHNKPYIICDTAHNFDGISIAMQQLQEIKAKTIHIIWGMVNDKDVSSIVTLLPKQAKYYLTKPSIDRGMEVCDLEKNFQTFDYSLHTSVANAYKSAIKNCKSDDLLYIGGSTFVVAEFLSKKMKK